MVSAENRIVYFPLLAMYLVLNIILCINFHVYVCSNREMISLLKLPLGEVVSPEGEPLPGDCSPKSDTTLKRSLSLCPDENEKMPTYNGDDDVTTPREEQSHPIPTPAIPFSSSFDSSESEVVGTPERTALKEQQVKVVEENPEGVVTKEDHNNDEKQKSHKLLVGQKFQHYTRVPQLRKDVSNKKMRINDDHCVR